VDVRQYEELALQLIPQADIPGAVVVAKHLGPHPEAPPGVIETLLDKAPEVAAALFATADKIDGGKLADRAEWGSLAEAVAIGRRSNLDARRRRLLRGARKRRCFARLPPTRTRRSMRTPPLIFCGADARIANSATSFWREPI
jgi:uncharacterized protein (DUF2336 family)